MEDDLKLYEQRLDKLYKEIKPIKSTGERFEIPKCEGHLEGNKTIISNFGQLVSALRRNQEHFAKFLMRELAAPGQIEGDRLILNITVPSSKINQKIEEYVKEFVLCKECRKPDTELIKQGRITLIKCLACGAKHPLRSKI